MLNSVSHLIHEIANLGRDVRLIDFNRNYVQAHRYVKAHHLNGHLVFAKPIRTPLTLYTIIFHILYLSYAGLLVPPLDFAAWNCFVALLPLILSSF